MMKSLLWSMLGLALFFLVLQLVHTAPRLLGLSPYDLLGATDVLVVNVVNPNNPGGGNSGGGSRGGDSSGGGGGTLGSAITGATAHFSGRAYPYSSVVLLKDGSIAVSTVAGGDARFDLSLAGLTPGSYVFAVYGSDHKGMRSSPISFPLTLTTGAVTTVGGIFLSPTIDTDKSTVKLGDTISFFGTSAPSSTITISVHSDVNLFVRAQTDAVGAYLYQFDTSPLQLGGHTAQAKSILDSDISQYGNSVIFSVGTITAKKTPNTITVGEGDLNNDGKINIIDFSIMAYWYHRPLLGSGFAADLNHDGKVDLTDFSILVSHWTG